MPKMTTKTTTTLLISLLVACGKSTPKPPDNPAPESATASTAAAAPAAQIIGPTAVRDVAVAQSHACAILASGQVACWGELHGSLEPLTTKPQLVAGITGAIAISAEDCVLRGDKPAMCWDNEGTVSEVPGTEGAKKIVRNDRNPCFLLATGSVTCWDERAKKPKPVPGLAKLRSIDNWAYNEWCYVTDIGAIRCSGDHAEDLGKALPTYPDAIDVVRVEQDTACVLRQGGVMSCFGRPEGAAKYPKRADQISERCVRADDTISCFAWSESASEWTWQPQKLDGKPSHLSCDSNTCCVILDGDLACWGDNSNGRLADGMPSVAKPTKVAGLPPVAEVFAGERFTMALTKDGDVYAWGTVGNGPHVPARIGSATMLALSMGGALTTTQRSARIHGADDKGWRSESLPSVPLDPIAIAMTDAHELCAALTDGSFRCLRPDASDDLHWISVAKMTDLTQLTGMGNSICGVTKAGAVECMINDRDEDDDRPPPIHGFVVPGIKTARRIAGTFVELTDGKVVQIHRDENKKWIVKAEPALAGMTSISSGGYGWSAACGIKDKHALCWFPFGGGDDKKGLLARSSKVPTGTPAPVEGLGEVRAVSAGNSHVCAVDTADAVWCWGDDNRGELGRGRVTYRAEAKRVSF